MKKLILPFLITAYLVACAAEEPASTTVDTATEATAGASSEKTYELTGTILGRSPEASTLRIDHQEIGDWMGAMTMTFPVRDAQFDTLPPDGASITATVHVSDGGDYWVTDVTEAGQELEPEADEEASEDEATSAEGDELSI